MKNLEFAISRFAICSEPLECSPYGNGHINSTFLLVCDDNGNRRRYILQSVNTNVFKKPEQVMQNIEKVTEYLRPGAKEHREIMTLIPTKDGKSCYVDEDGKCWRIYDFIEDSICLEHPESTEDFRQCAVAFGKFQRDLSRFPADSLFETIPDFHNTPKRFADFLQAVENDAVGRAAFVKEEIQFLKDRVDFYSVLYNANKAGVLPLRVTHNDTKSNNVMLDAKTRKALCVIDLDTIMPGFSVTDFGDAIRFGASTAAEDEKDLSKVSLDLEMFDIYTKGYLEGCGGQLSREEIMLMPEGAKMMTIECGMRFLTDYLNGDTYFKTAYAEHNLDRCHTQLKLVADMEEKWDEMKKIVEKYI
ncbi:MAG: aminoglycoside phosphotransferase family protein [Ruminococcaceae bacterium]|nr:aminoglycoside phosphotransferase family protein [Oscillospiraceae bacterium]